MLRVVTYHRVADDAASSTLNPRLISATPAGFGEQMAHLAKNYNVVTMAEVLEAIEKRRRLAPRAVLITFDDAYRDFGEVAWPILRKHRLPVTLFVPTAYPGQPERRFWWDRLHQAITGTSRKVLGRTRIEVRLDTPEERRASLRKIQSHIKDMPHAEAMALVDRICARCGEARTDQRTVHNWNELRELARDGVTLGAHTQTHPLLTQLTPPEARKEIRCSQEDLRREIGNVLPIFCYPNGSYNEGIVRIMREERFVLSLTTEDGQNDLDLADPLQLRRTNITPRTTPAIFRLRLMRLGTYVDSWRHRAQRVVETLSGQ